MSFDFKTNPQDTKNDLVPTDFKGQDPEHTPSLKEVGNFGVVFNQIQPLCFVL